MPARLRACVHPCGLAGGREGVQRSLVCRSVLCASSLRGCLRIRSAGDGGRGMEDGGWETVTGSRPRPTRSTRRDAKGAWRPATPRSRLELVSRVFEAWRRRSLSSVPVTSLPSDSFALVTHR